MRLLELDGRAGVASRSSGKNCRWRVKTTLRWKCAFLSCKAELAEEFGEFVGEVDEYVWRGGGQGVRGKAVRDADGEEAGVSAGFNVDVGVADDDGLMGRHAGFVEQF